MAEVLHMTVEHLRDSMSNKEYLEWRAYTVWRKAMRELETKEISRGR